MDLSSGGQGSFTRLRGFYLGFYEGVVGSPALFCCREVGESLAHPLKHSDLSRYLERVLVSLHVAVPIHLQTFFGSVSAGSLSVWGISRSTDL